MLVLKPGISVPNVQSWLLSPVTNPKDARNPGALFCHCNPGENGVNVPSCWLVSSTRRQLLGVLLRAPAAERGPVWGRLGGVLWSRIDWKMGFLPSSLCLMQQLVVGCSDCFL